MGRFGGDRAMLLQRFGGNADHLYLGLVGIGDEAAVDHRRRSGDVGEQRDDHAAGAGFGRRHQYLAMRAGLQEAVRQVAPIIHSGTSPGKITLAVAIAAIPSSRPMKPRRSFVVALIEMRPAEMFSMEAIASTMASRCGPMRGASQISVMSALAMR